MRCAPLARSFLMRTVGDSRKFFAPQALRRFFVLFFLKRIDTKS